MRGDCQKQLFTRHARQNRIPHRKPRAEPTNTHETVDSGPTPNTKSERACVAIAEGGALEFHATRVAIGARNGRGRGEQEQEKPRQRLHNVWTSCPPCSSEQEPAAKMPLVSLG